MSDLKQLPTIADEERSALVEQLLGQIEHLLEENGRQAEIIQQMRDEIAVLKGQKAKPKFKPSGMESETGPDDDRDGREEEDSGSGEDEGAGRKPRKRAGSSKRSKSEQLVVHETIKVAPRASIPQGSRFKGYRDFIVQDLRIEAHNTCYRREVWLTPEGHCWSVNCRRVSTAGTSGRSFVAMCSISTTTAMSPSRCCMSNCASGASTSRLVRSTLYSAATTMSFSPRRTNCW
jgi:hypothetical protein